MDGRLHGIGPRGNKRRDKYANRQPEPSNRLDAAEEPRSSQHHDAQSNLSGDGQLGIALLEPSSNDRYVDEDATIDDAFLFRLTLATG